LSFNTTSVSVRACRKAIQLSFLKFQYNFCVGSSH